MVSFLCVSGSPISSFSNWKTCLLQARFIGENRLPWFHEKYIYWSIESHIFCISKNLQGSMWNLAIMQCKPVVISRPKNWYNVLVGLCYDKIMKDFNIVYIVPFRVWRLCCWKVSVNKDIVQDERSFTFLPKRCHCQFIIQNVPYWTVVTNK